MSTDSKKLKRINYLINTRFLGVALMQINFVKNENKIHVLYTNILRNIYYLF